MKVTLLHEEVFMPEWIKNKVKNMQRRTTKYIISDHFKFERSCKNKKHNVKCEELLDVMEKIHNNPISPFEVEITEIKGNKKVTKYVFRTSFSENEDISVVVRDNRIITCWLNAKTDNHFTLNSSKYAKKV